MDLDARKPAFVGLRTTKAQTRLRGYVLLLYQFPLWKLNKTGSKTIMLFRVTFIDASHDVNSCKKQLSIDLNVQLI